MMPRATADLIALILAGVVAVIVLGTAAVLLWEELTGQSNTAEGAADFVSRVVGVLVGLLAGYIAGRRINGEH